MTKDEALDLALEALERYVEEDEVAEGMPENEPWVETKRMGEKAITAIKQARSALVQSCYCPNCEALSKELAALKAQPTVPLTDDWIRSKCKQTWVFETAKQWVRMTEEAHGITAAPVQEPVAWHDKIIGMEVSMDVSTGDDDIDHRVYGQVYEVMLAYDGGPDVILAIESERNFTTPPAQPAPVQEPVCHICGGTGEMDSGGTLPWGEAINIPCECTAPPAAQRQWVGLTDEQVDKAAMKLAECMDYPWTQMPEQGKQSMRIHAKAVIEATHGITGETK